MEWIGGVPCSVWFGFGFDDDWFFVEAGGVWVSIGVLYGSVVVTIQIGSCGGSSGHFFVCSSIALVVVVVVVV